MCKIGLPFSTLLVQSKATCFTTKMLLHIIFQKNKYHDSISLSTVVSPLVHQICSSLYSLPHCQQESEIQSSTSLF